MEELQKRTWAEISLQNIIHNYRDMKSKLPEDCRFMGLLKANAYGHGAVKVAHALENAGVDYFAVACIDEAKELRDAGIKTPILILGPSPAEYARELAALDVTQAVSSLESAKALSNEMSRAGGCLKVHMKLETGMGRTGFNAADGLPEKGAFKALELPGLDFEGVFTHFAVSDEDDGAEYTAEQVKSFNSAVKALEESRGCRFKIKHCANSGAMLNYNELYMDMVRPGIALYGHYTNGEKEGFNLLPAMELKTRIAAVTEHKAGDTVSYGRTFTCERDMRLAVLPIGYADGLHRLLSNRMEVLIHGHRVRQVGRICMDMCMADISGIPDAAVGDEVTVFGCSGGVFLPVEEQAKKAETISYELLCSVSPRVPRVYTENN